MLDMKFFEQSLISSLGKLGLLVNQRHQIHGFHANQVKNLLIILELNVLPVDVLDLVLILLHL